MLYGVCDHSDVNSRLCAAMTEISYGPTLMISHSIDVAENSYKPVNHSDALAPISCDILMNVSIAVCEIRRHRQWSIPVQRFLILASAIRAYRRILV